MFMMNYIHVIFTRRFVIHMFGILGEMAGTPVGLVSSYSLSLSLSPRPFYVSGLEVLYHDCISWAAYMASIFSGFSMKTKQKLPVISKTKPRTSPVQFLPYSIGQQASLESRPGGVDSTTQ